MSLSGFRDYRRRKQYNQKLMNRKVVCEKQFPDCPKEINEQNCKECPLFEK